MDALVAAVAGLAVALLLSWWLWLRDRRRLKARHKEMASARQSQATRYGQITEQFAPFMAQWPWDPKAFRFIGTPIDGIQFTADGVVFVEIKSANSSLSPVQRRVRNQVLAGRVYWHEVRVG